MLKRITNNILGGAERAKYIRYIIHMGRVTLYFPIAGGNKLTGRKWTLEILVLTRLCRADRRETHFKLVAFTIHTICNNECTLIFTAVLIILIGIGSVILYIRIYELRYVWGIGQQIF